MLIWYLRTKNICSSKYCKRYSDKDKNITTHYVYDEYSNIVIQAQFDNDTATIWPEEYTPEHNYDSVIKHEYNNGKLIKTTENDNTITSYLYDNYGNVAKTTTTVTKDNQTIISISESQYDILNRLISSKSDNSEISYTYDAAGRTILTNTDGKYQRTVYDNYGRVIQEISDTDYKLELDNLPDAYTDFSVGQRYIYDESGNLIREINDSDIETNYTYSDVGILYKKSFDIYDYYYKNDGRCDRIDVNGKTIVDYDYKVQDSNVKIENDQYINRVTYADGYVEEQKVDKTGNVYSSYANGSSYYSVYASNKTKFSYYESEALHRTTITSLDNSYIYLKQTNSFKDIFSYSVQSDNDNQTITEKHFGNEYKTITNENSISYSTPKLSFEYSMDGNDDIATQKINSGENNVITSSIAYSENSNVLTKSYSNLGLDFSVEYDDKGNIIADENNTYEYDTLGELVSSQGNINSSYTYDSRGNMLTKTVGDETIAFTYSNDDWCDQLTAVNGNELTYDANGNLTSYAGKEYTWNHGKRLASITDSENTYSYTYDSNGIRTAKTVNGVKTNFNTLNGKLLAQYDGTNNIYFQYYNDTPIGFELNTVQYFYVTNLNGDIVAITDADGNLIAEYSYDEWGKLLAIETAEENNEEQLAVAEMNPLRYRGYYYDSETGMYYLQSRYYSPELCHFISADDFSCLDTSNKLNANAYIYCWNCPVAFHDVQGTTPKLSVNLADIISFIQNINNRIKDGITAEINKMTEKWNKLTNNFKNSLKIRYNNFIDKLEYALNYPDAVINDTLSKIFNKDVNIRFRLIELIREKTNFKIDLSNLKKEVSIENNNPSLFKSAKKYVSEAGKVIGVLITEIFTCLDLQEIAKKLGKTFSFDNFEDYLQKKVDLYREAFDKGIVKLWTSANDSASSTAGWLSNIAGLFDKLLPKNISSGISALPYIVNFIDDTSGRYISPIGTIDNYNGGV